MSKSLVELDVLHIELQGGLALPCVVFEMVADAEWLAVVDAIEIVAFLEGNAREGCHAQFLVAHLTHGEFQMLMAAHGTRAACVNDLIGPEYGGHVARTEGCKLVEDAHELRRNVAEVDFHVDL